MTIRDIAKQAGVSVATVSRIMNHKDSNISQETRERVLKVIQDSGYVPYAKIRERLLTKENTIGLVIPTLETYFYASFASEVQRIAQANHYTLLLSITEGNSCTEIDSLHRLRAGNVDSILFFPGSQEGLAALEELQQDGVSAVVLDHVAKDALFPQLYRDRKHNAQCCTEHLLQYCHKVALILRKECGSLSAQYVCAGYEAALQSGGLLIDSGLVAFAGDDFEKVFDNLIEIGAEGILCQDADLAGLVYTLAMKKCLHIPKDLSILSMEDAPLSTQLTPALSAWASDPKEMAESAMEALFWQLQQKNPGFTSKMIPSHFEDRDSILTQQNHCPKIMIVGSMNMDIVLQVPRLPCHGEIVMANQLTTWPGGKGANQALGVSRLGGSAHMLGCLGNDRYGRQVFEQLASSHVDMSGVSMSSELPTGTAYISVGTDGGSTIVVHGGANNHVNEDYIRHHLPLLQSAKYCLLQMEIPFDAVQQTMAFCKEYRIHTILKPSPARVLSDELLDGLFLLVPSEEEANILCPQQDTPREQAQYLLTKGVQNVIITMGESGCLWACKGGIQAFPAHRFPRVDSTGASDVFISCLAVMLAEENSMEYAIRAACWAASYSVSHTGVQAAIPSRKLLDEFLKSEFSQ